MSKLRLELQSELHECGLACLAMVLSSYDRGVDLLTLRAQGVHTGLGLTLHDLSDLAQRLGYVTRGLRLELDQVPNLRLPVILHWDLNHFVVLAKIRRWGRSRYQILDPATGSRWLTSAQLGAHFTGVALEVWPGGPLRPVNPVTRLRLRDIWRLVGAQWHPLASLIFLSLALQILVLVGPWHLQWTVDEVLISADLDLLAVLSIGFAAVLALRVLTTWMRGVLVIRIGHQLSFQLASKLFMHLLKLPATWVETRFVGDIASRFSSLGPVRDLFTHGAAALLIDLVIVLLSLLVMFLYEPALAGIVLLAQSVYLLLFATMIPRMRATSAQLVVSGANEQNQLLESLRGFVSVKVYAQEQQRFARWQREHVNMLHQGVSLQHQQLGIALAGQLLAGGELILIVTLGAHGVLRGDMSVGMLFAFVTYRGFFAEHVQNLVNEGQHLATIRVHLRRLTEIWSAQPEHDGPGSRLPRAYRGGLGFDNISFAFHPQIPVLNGVQFAVRPGEFVALIGPSGAGKSTVLKLFMGLLRPQEGAVCVDSIPLTPNDLRAYRASLGCVMQEDQFFAGSVADNIARFQSVDPDRLSMVLRAVGMFEAINKLPLREQTRFTDIGGCFSTGELQRLFLARALYGAPQYLFLDEITANLDDTSAQILRDLIAGLECTRFVVTHDHALARLADRMVTLHHGQLISAREKVAVVQAD